MVVSQTGNHKMRILVLALPEPRKHVESQPIWPLVMGFEPLPSMFLRTKDWLSLGKPPDFATPSSAFQMKTVPKGPGTFITFIGAPHSTQTPVGAHP